MNNNNTLSETSEGKLIAWAIVGVLALVTLGVAVEAWELMSSVKGIYGPAMGM